MVSLTLARSGPNSVDIALEKGKRTKCKELYYSLSPQCFMSFLDPSTCIYSPLSCAGLSLWNPRNSSKWMCPLSFSLNMLPTRFWYVLFSLYLRNHLMSRGKKIPHAAHRGAYKEHKPCRAPAATPPALLGPFVLKTPSHLKGIKIWTYLHFPLSSKKNE